MRVQNVQGFLLQHFLYINQQIYGEYESNLMIISSCSFDGFAPYLIKALDVILSLPLYDHFEFDKRRYISEFREIYETYPKSESDRMSFFGTPDAIRTHDLQSRSLTLYPAELQAHIKV